MQKQTIISPGKWILAGEHSVVRGGSALVFPLLSRSLELHLLTSTDEAFTSEIHSLDAALQLATKNALITAEEYLKVQEITLPPLKLMINLTCDIPVASGLGSSAALSVAVAEIFVRLGIVKNLLPLALYLENLFHGKSSGLDVAAVFQKSPLEFCQGRFEVFEASWQPKMYLLDTQLRAHTKGCVEQVEKLRRPDLDQAMDLAVNLAKTALAANEQEGLALLKESLVLGQSCFRQWGLVPKEVAELESYLLDQGALAVKTTGSGNGGFLLSLWNKRPPEELGLISCF